MAEPTAPSRQLRLGIVLSTTEDICTVAAGDERLQVAYLSGFPSPRTERVTPGHLVAIAGSGTQASVCWRWYDAVVVGSEDGRVRLWEPAHGNVLAAPRDSGATYRPGSRAYLSAGLPGADWWVSGPAVDRAQDADVELAEVCGFLDEIGGWPSVST